MVKIRQTNNSRHIAPPRRWEMRLMAGVSAATTMLGSLALMALPAQAFISHPDDPENAYKLCGERLDQAGVAKEIAAKACAEVLHPDRVSQCTLDISAKQVDVLATLSACRRVRRPLELSTCVLDIHAQDAEAVLPNVMEACRQSLLPKRYGKCVVGLNQSLAMATPIGLSTCIDASDRPTDVLSTFKPLKDVPRMNGFGAAGAAESSVLQPGAKGSVTGGESSVTGAGTPQLY
ncbi:hypothetical protein IQ266_13410 [filamentous cyanobacterium LEGE 11480]|uniref:Uncharacterized protein n=1 Tax=Romeriopsis navalis LEGE 11480 TaxID=2777977 RepID=A0A928VRE2_9CYAN|nr:hypothetical protein [Romeriopsis navalis]MBE9030729.1 hypothetical protein [Romeriopsis navalis LEGE 11480]